MNGPRLAVSVLYLPQVMGLTEQTLKLNLNLTYAPELKKKLPSADERKVAVR